VRVQEIDQGLWRWTGLHPDWSPDEDWGEEVGCVFLETSEAIAIIDPLVPPEEPERFLAALDRDVERAGLPIHVLITIFWHARNARDLVARYEGTRVWAHEPARELVEERTPVTDVFRPGDTLPGGVVAVDAHRAFEVLFWLSTHDALVTGDVLLGSDEGGLSLCPQEWLGPRDPMEVRRGIRESLRGRAVERILPAHGEPVLADATRILDAALAEN
jgi:glyoxylase-like metal-dependent hydrolase (beta-lactamase superfamily II)